MDSEATAYWKVMGTVRHCLGKAGCRHVKGTHGEALYGYALVQLCYGFAGRGFAWRITKLGSGRVMLSHGEAECCGGSVERGIGNEW